VLQLPPVLPASSPTKQAAQIRLQQGQQLHGEQLHGVYIQFLLCF
jgi:hypothetical protein